MSPAGFAPHDGVAKEQIVTVHPALTGVFSSLASAGIAFATLCLVFNFVYRNEK